MAVTYKQDKSGYHYVYQYYADTGTFSSNLYATLPLDYFRDTAVLNDALYIAPNANTEMVYDGLVFNVGTAIAGTLTLVWEYYNTISGAWEPIVDIEDHTQGLTVLGVNRVRWDNEKQTGWGRTIVNGLNRVWVRIRISSLTSITEGGQQVTDRILRDTANIDIASYTSTTPATYQDIYDADKAGTLDLIQRTGITAADTTAVNNTFNLYPADYYVLGGPRNDVYITVTNFTGFTDATIRLSGTDASGAAQTEDIVITADGTYNSTQLWRTIDSTQVTAVTGTGSFDYTLTQGQWGVFEKKGNQIYIRRPLTFTGTYFEETSKHVYIDAEKFQKGNGTSLHYADGSSSVTFGAVADVTNKVTEQGIHFFVNNKDKEYFSFLSTGTGTIINYYGCTFDSAIRQDGTMAIQGNSTTPSNIWNSGFYYQIQCGLNGSAYADVYNIFAIRNTAGVRRPTVNTSVDKVSFIAPSLGQPVWFQTNEGSAENIYSRGAGNVVRMESIPDNTNSYLKYVDTDTWNVVWANTTGSAIVNRVHKYQIKIEDEKGNPIQGAQVRMTVLSTGAEVFNLTTDANGEIPAQDVTVSYCQYPDDNLDTNPTVDYRPFKVVIKKAGYETHVGQEDFDRGDVVQTIPLTRSCVNLSQQITCG